MRYPVATALVALAWLMSSCSSPGGVAVTLDEFSLGARPSDAPAGSVTFRIRNVGEIPHDFMVLHTDRADDRLPVRRQEADVSARGIRLVRRLSYIRAGSTRTLTIRLDPGRYVLICNIASHYSSGMHAGFRARRGVSPGS